MRPKSRDRLVDKAHNCSSLRPSASLVGANTDTEALEAVFRGREKMPSNAFPRMTTQAKKTKAFTSLGEGFSRKGHRIVYRDQRNGRATWLSTGTNSLPLAPVKSRVFQACRIRGELCGNISGKV